MTDLTTAITSETKPVIPLKDLYRLGENQEFFTKNSVRADERFLPPLNVRKSMSLKGEKPYDNDYAEARRQVLLDTGLYEKVEFVDELDVTTGEPTGGYGFIVTKKPPAAAEA
jgi:hypothetical protein